MTAEQKVAINAGSDIDLFAQGGELRQITHQRSMLLQAQKNDIRLEAEQSVEVSVSQQHMLVVAKEHIILMCGGVCLALRGGNIELGMSGNLVIKVAKYNHVGPVRVLTNFNTWDSIPLDGRYVLCGKVMLESLPNIAVEVI